MNVLASHPYRVPVSTVDAVGFVTDSPSLRTRTWAWPDSFGYLVEEAEVPGTSRSALDLLRHQIRGPPRPGHIPAAEPSFPCGVRASAADSPGPLVLLPAHGARGGASVPAEREVRKQRQHAGGGASHPLLRRAVAQACPEPEHLPDADPTAGEDTWPIPARSSTAP